MLTMPDSQQIADLIRYRRSDITVLDRAALEGHVRQRYEVVKKEFDRLLPEHART